MGKGRDGIVVPYKPNKKQSIFHACGADEVVYGGAKGGGKALKLDTPIPTPHGWTTMREIKPGDYVFGENGEPVLVVAQSEIMENRPCYKLTFDDGTEIIADEQHLWKTFTAKDLVALGRNSIRTTQEIHKTLITEDGSSWNHAVMTAGELRFIISCEPVPSVPVKCIQVAGGMYLCGKGMIPTHNSCGLVMEALAYGLEHPEATIYLFRETYDDLEANLIREWKEKVPKELYQYHETKHTATLINKTMIYFRYIRNYQDAISYQGRSMDFIGVDELTNYEERSIQVLLSCLRSPKGYPPRFRGTCNPGGIGHPWVKKRYIDSTNYGKKQVVDSETGNTIAFIPAKVYDNFVIMKNDPAYVKRLENLPPALKKAYRDGDWDAYEGQAFAEFNYETHICEPFVIPEHWTRWRSVDNGYTDPFAWYWFAVSEDGIVYIYREYTRDMKDEKIGYSDQAKRVVELSTYTKLDEYGEEIKVEEPYSFIAAGLDAWATHVRDVQGKTLINYYEDGGLSGFVKPITDRKLRKATWHEYLKPFDHPDQERFPGKKIARVQIFSTCKKLIETLPVLIEDESNPEAVAECDLDHWYDGAGYGLIVWHSKQSRTPKKEEKSFPLAYKDKLAKQQQTRRNRGRLM